MSLRFPIPFAKMSGTGNDFIIIDHRSRFLDRSGLADFVRAVCRRRFSVGADGLILLEESKVADFDWQFYNGDGSIAEMCGNGARCAARFAYEEDIAPAEMRFGTLAGVIEAFVDEKDHRLVKIRLTAPENMHLHRKLTVAGETKTVHSINTGVPHAVFMVKDASVVPIVEWGRIVRYHEMFQPAGANVNFVQVLPDKSLFVRTYERGVEGETMACGTGAVASAIVAAQLDEVSSPVRVTTSGGEHLTISFSISESQEAAVYLEGPTHFIYKGYLSVDALG